VLSGWEDNYRSGIALAMHHRLCGISTDELSSLRKGDEHPIYAPVRRMAPFTVLLAYMKKAGRMSK